MNFRVIWTTCFFVFLAAIGPATGAEKLGSGAFQHDYASANGWIVHRITADEAGRKLLYCDASWTGVADMYAYVRRDPANKTFAFGLPAPNPVRQKNAPMRAWFDSDKANAMEGPATFLSWSGKADDEDGYLVLVQTGDQAPAAERFPKAKKITFAYPFDGKTRVESFILKNAATTLAKLTDCAAIP